MRQKLSSFAVKVVMCLADQCKLPRIVNGTLGARRVLVLLG